MNGKSVGRRASWRPLVSWKVLVPTVAALGLGVGGAVAAGAVGSDPTITGCYLTPGATYTEGGGEIGSLRVINQPSELTDTADPGATSCGDGEATITWDQQGVPGATGPQGDTGPQGPQGPAGPTGAISSGRRGPASTGCWTTPRRYAWHAGGTPGCVTIRSTNKCASWWRRWTCWPSRS